MVGEWLGEVSKVTGAPNNKVGDLVSGKVFLKVSEFGLLIKAELVNWVTLSIIL